MFTRYRTEGLFLKRIDRGEADQVFTVYTKDFGKLKIFAKAVRKVKSKLKTAAEIFYYSEIEFVQGKTHKILTDAVCVEKFPNLRKNLLKLQIAYKIGQMIDDLLDGEERDKEVWDLIMAIFKKLETDFNDNSKIETVYYYFLWNFFSILGYQPEVRQCVICQQKLIPDNLYFSPERGGVICRKCFGVKKIGEMISPETVKILRILLKRNWPVLSKIKIKEQYKDSLITLSESYFSYIFSRKSL
ncbi:MAG: DNA repair protein RecO [bacterium]